MTTTPSTRDLKRDHNTLVKAYNWHKGEAELESPPYKTSEFWEALKSIVLNHEQLMREKRREPYD